MNKMHKGLGWVRFVSLASCCILLAVSLLGCDSVRRKFVRKSKAQKAGEDYIPVLEPVDYSVAQQPAVERYKYHYSFWCALDKELITEVEANDNDKKQKFLLARLIVHAQQMQQLLVEEKSEIFKKIAEDLAKIGQELEKPANVRNIYFMKRSLMTADHTIRQDYNPRAMENYFIDHVPAPESS